MEKQQRVTSLRRFHVAAVAAALAWTAQLSGARAPQAAPQAAPAPAAATAPDLKATVDTYCVTCHNQRLKTGGLTLDDLSVSDPAAHADVWEKVIRKVRGGMMPPAGLPRPPADVQTALVSSLETTLDRTARLAPN